MMNITQYLKRINYHGTLEPTIQTLHQLHLAHLRSVPFENLSIHLQQPIILDDSSLFTKIIEQNRGGFCYELNGLFSGLLKQLGFQITLLSAQVAREDGTFGREFGHLTLLVQDSERWLVDVGFGDSFIYPLKLDNSQEQIQADQRYQLVNESEYWILYKYEDIWKPQYCFNLNPRKLTDFTAMCNYNQTADQSIFKQRLICTQATEAGRITLSDRKLIITQNNQRNETLIDTEIEYQQVLKNYFKIDLTCFDSQERKNLFNFLFSK